MTYPLAPSFAIALETHDILSLGTVHAIHGARLLASLPFLLCE